MIIAIVAPRQIFFLFAARWCSSAFTNCWFASWTWTTASSTWWSIESKNYHSRMIYVFWSIRKPAQDKLSVLTFRPSIAILTNHFSLTCNLRVQITKYFIDANNIILKFFQQIIILFANFIMKRSVFPIKDSNIIFYLELRHFSVPRLHCRQLIWVHLHLGLLSLAVKIAKEKMLTI